MRGPTWPLSGRGGARGTLPRARRLLVLLLCALCMDKVCRPRDPILPGCLGWGVGRGDDGNGREGAQSAR